MKNTHMTTTENPVRSDDIVEKSFFEKANSFLHKFAYLISPLIVFLIFAVLFSLNDIWPFGKLSVSWLDGNQQYIPLLCDFKDILAGRQGFFLSGANAGGMNFYGVFFFNLSSPFTFLVALFDKADMGDAFNLIIILKLMTASVTCTLLLRTKTNRFALSVFPSVLYAFSGYAMMYYQIAQWLDVFYMFPLLFMGLERMIAGRSNLLYIISLFLTVLFHFYLTYPVVIFLCIYASLYALYNGKEAKKFCFSFISGSIIAALLGCVILLPCFLQYTTSMRTSSIIKTLGNSSFSPSGCTSYPTFFCLAVPSSFAVFYLLTEYKDFRCAALILSAFPIFVEPIAKAWQTFNYMSFPTRYGFIPILLTLYLSVCGAEKLLSDGCRKISDQGGDVLTRNGKEKFLDFIKGKSTASVIFYSVLITAAAIAFAFFSRSYYADNSERLSRFALSLWGDVASFNGLALHAVILVAFSVIAFAAIRFKVAFKNVVIGAIALLIVVDSVFSCKVYMISSAVMRSESSNISVRLERLSELDGLINDDGFYRVKSNKKYFEVNMIGAMGYNSFSHYTSLNSRNYMTTAKTLGYSSYWMEVNSDGGTVFSDALLRNKYTLKTGNSGKDYVTAGGNYSITENKLLFPSAFVIPEGGEYRFDESIERQAIAEEFFNKLTGKSGLIEKYGYRSLTGVEDHSTEGKTVLIRKTAAEGGSVVFYSIKITGKRRLYFDLFDKYTNSLSEPTYKSIGGISVISKNGFKYFSHGEYPEQTANGILDLGSYSDCEISVKITLKRNIDAVSFGLFSIDTELLESAVHGLIGADLKQKANGFLCKIESLDGGNLFIPVPYDAGFSARVNGKKKEIKYFGGFISVPIDKGLNNVELSFVPRGFFVGLIVSLFGVALLVCYVISSRKGFGLKSGKAVEIAYGLSRVAVFALGVAVVAVIYLFPVVVNILF